MNGWPKGQRCRRLLLQSSGGELVTQSADGLRLHLESLEDAI